MFYNICTVINNMIICMMQMRYQIIQKQKNEKIFRFIINEDKFNLYVGKKTIIYIKVS